MKINEPTTKTIAACAIALLAANASAIQMATQPYRESPEIQKIDFSVAGVSASTSSISSLPSGPVEIWTIKRESYLHETLREWSARAGWTLVWGLGENEDLRMDAGNDFRGDFKTVIKELFNSFPAGVRINAELRPDNSPPLIFINHQDGAR